MSVSRRDGKALYLFVYVSVYECVILQDNEIQL